MANNVGTSVTTLENKYNLGEPVAIYAWVKGVELVDSKFEYKLEIKNDDGKHLLTLTEVPEDLILTVF